MSGMRSILTGFLRLLNRMQNKLTDIVLLFPVDLFRQGEIKNERKGKRLLDI